MIKANELRVGNWVQDGKLTYQVGEIEGDFGSANAIPITPEILENCGFRRKNWDNQYYPGKFELTMETDSDAFFKYYSDQEYLQLWSSDGGDTSIVKKDIKYLHQLQNLYFAMTGQELEIKL